MAELKPCPACGSKIATPVLEYDGKFPQLGYVRCREITCGLKTGLFADGGRHAVEIWNSIPRTDDVRGVAFWVDTQPHLDDSSYKKDNMAYYCSNCHHRAGKYKHRSYKFCPWCGARMAEVIEDA